MQWVETGNPAVAVYVREHDEESILVFNNLSDSDQTVTIPAAYQKTCCDFFDNQAFTLGEQLELRPDSYRWIQL